MFGSLPDLLLVVLGFGLIVFLHELGHFVAARWAGIRVLAFAIGFGPALVSYRKGLGWRRGSSEREMLDRAAGEPGPPVSSTEYRLNVLPFGGYVKMLGQEDANPEAVSDEPDSFQRCVPWKRLVVISAGVVMNLITAAALFVVVFMVGMKVEPARVGAVYPGSPAATTAAINARELGITSPGLLPGDRILSINGEPPRSFNDLMLATAMAEQGLPVELTVARSGFERPLVFLVRPQVGAASGLLELGLEPSRSGSLAEVKNKQEREDFIAAARAFGVPDLRPGMTLTTVNGRPASDANDLFAAVRESHGAPVRLSFRDEAGKGTELAVVPRPQFQLDHLPSAANAVIPVEHLLGLMPVMTVGKTTPAAEKQGLRDGDLFARIDNIEYPSIAQGIAKIRGRQGGTLPVVVLRRDDVSGEYREITLPKVAVNAKGQIGFGVGDTSKDAALVAMALESLRHPGEDRNFTPAAFGVVPSPGTRILSVNGEAVANFADLRETLRSATRTALTTKSRDCTVQLRVRKPVGGVLTESAPIDTIDWKLTLADVEALHALGWEGPAMASLFEPEQVVLRASSPREALSMGLAETRRVMLTTYVTFLRLFQGSVKIEHLKGPVGIAHLGTLVASRGFMWLLFFLALISVNLAVINFLPLPIVDGGQFLFILFEAVRGRPVPMAVQSAATIAGLVLIGCVFLIVTYNDIRNLLGL